MPKKNFLYAVLSLLIASGILCPAFADDFPGKGDRFAWGNALPYYNLANKYLAHGRFEEAKTNFEEAIYRYEYDPDFYINYGVALRKLENYKAAEEAFKKAIELRNNDWQAWSNLANAYLKQNRLKDTIACFQKAMKMQPPPPKEEREAMLKDIADINKILSMQAPPPSQARANAADEKSPRSGAKAGTKPSVSKTGTLKAQKIIETASQVPGAQPGSKDKKTRTASGTSTAGVTGAASMDPPVTNKESLKKSGWDWVQ